MHSSIINGEGLLKGQPANPGSPGKWLLKLRACEEFHFVSSTSDKFHMIVLYFCGIILAECICFSVLFNANNDGWTLCVLMHWLFILLALAVFVV